MQLGARRPRGRLRTCGGCGRRQEREEGRGRAGVAAESGGNCRVSVPPQEEGEADEFRWHYLWEMCVEWAGTVTRVCRRERVVLARRRERAMRLNKEESRWQGLASGMP